jgi:membrane-bound lytic murein transglycosylase B
MITRRLVCLAAALAPAVARAQPTDPKFSGWLAGLRSDALRAGVDQGTLDSAFSNIDLIPRVIELAHNQPEFKRSTWPSSSRPSG